MASSLQMKWFSLRERLFLLRHKTDKDRFGAIFANNIWGNLETTSGFGSTQAATEGIRQALPRLIQQYEIATFLDAPCGDFNWLSRLDLDVNYIGVDIVGKLVQSNRHRFGNDRRIFLEKDICTDPLPTSDLILCRECLNHIPLQRAHQAVTNVCASAARLLMITHYPMLNANFDQPSSFRYRPLNLTLPPFSLRTPDDLIDESAFEPGKTIAVWNLLNGSALAAERDPF